jgi:hypothetical protein
MDNAGLHDRLRPDLADRVGQPLQAVADQHQHVFDATVLQLGQHPQPVLGSFTALAAGPQSQDVPVALGHDRQRHTDGPVGDLALADRIFTLMQSMNTIG